MASMIEIEQRDLNGARLFTADTGKSGFKEGFAMASLNGNELVLDSIHVIPGSRKNGLGSELIKAILAWGKSKGALSITGDFDPEYKGGLDEENARSFYKKCQIIITDDNKLIGEIK